MPKPCDYSKLGYDGFVPKDTYVGDGDIIRNSTHTATSIVSITFTGSTATSANVTLSSVAGISPGHHVQLSLVSSSTNLNFSVSK